MKHVFGPVASRRLGYSLGVETIPTKTCSFACIYCQAGKTTNHTDKRDEYVMAKDVISELESLLPQKDLHYITFSGSGEPTLNSKIGVIIRRIKEISDVPVCVITNSSLIWRKDVQKDIRPADLVIPSLDSAVQETFQKINRPVKGITVEKIINGLAKFKKSYTGLMRLEIMLVKGLNDTPDEIAKLKEATEKIKPDFIDLNTVVRPPVEKTAGALDMKELQRVVGFFGENAKIVSSFDKTAHSQPGDDLEEEVYQLVRRRGVTLSDLVTGFGMHRDIAADILERLIFQKKIKKVTFAGQTYYREKYS